MVFGGGAGENMGLEDDLKARTSPSSVSRWRTGSSRSSADPGTPGGTRHALDELGETVARYDEKIDEGSIAKAMAEVVAAATAGRRRPRLQRPQGGDRRHRKGHQPLRGADSPDGRGHAPRRARSDVHRQEQRRGRVARTRLRSPGGGEAGDDPAHRRHGVPHRPRLAQRHARPHQPLPRDGAGAGSARRRAAGTARGAADPARQGRRDPLLRHDTGRVPAADRRPRRDHGRVRGKGDRHPERRSQVGRRTGRHEPGLRQAASARCPRPMHGHRLPARPPRRRPTAAGARSGPALDRPAASPGAFTPAPAARAAAGPGARARSARAGGPEGPRGRQALRAPGGERDQALQRGQGHRGPQAPRTSTSA